MDLKNLKIEKVLSVLTRILAEQEDVKISYQMSSKDEEEEAVS